MFFVHHLHTSLHLQDRVCCVARSSTVAIRQGLEEICRETNGERGGCVVRSWSRPCSPGLHPTFSGSIFKYKQYRPLVYKPGPSPTEGKERVDLTLRGNVLLVVGGRVHRSIISRETGSQRDRERSTCSLCRFAPAKTSLQNQSKSQILRFPAPRRPHNNNPTSLRLQVTHRCGVAWYRIPAREAF